MKIKNTLCSILSLAVAGSISLGLVACDGDDPAGGGGGTVIVSEKVTKEEWESAFTETNFIHGTVKLIETRKGDINLDGVNTANGTATITTDVVIAGDKQYMKRSYSATGEKALVDFVAGLETEEQYTFRYDGDANNPIYIYYGKKDLYGQDWGMNDDKVHWQIRDGVNGEGLFDFEIEMLLSYETLYEDFEYNDAKKGYTVKEDAQYSEQLEGTVLKFKDCKIVAVETEKSNFGANGVTFNESYTITYGTQTITLPTAAETPYDGTWNTSHVYDAVFEERYEVGDIVDDYLGSSSAELKADTMQIVFKNDGTATYKYLGHSNPCVWDYYGDDTIILYSNNLPDGYPRWYLKYDEETDCIYDALNEAGNVFIYIKKVTE